MFKYFMKAIKWHGHDFDKTFSFDINVFNS